jgi:hypothetical protein
MPVAVIMQLVSANTHEVQQKQIMLRLIACYNCVFGQRRSTGMLSGAVIQHAERRRVFPKSERRNPTTGALHKIVFIEGNHKFLGLN